MAVAFDQTKYIESYLKDHIKQVRVSLNKKHDADMIAWLAKQGNASGYIKRLIQADMDKYRYCCKMCDDCDCDTKECRNPQSPFYGSIIEEAYFCQMFRCETRT